MKAITVEPGRSGAVAVGVGGTPTLGMPAVMSK